ncbi:MAG: hypothetical protein OEV93_02930 [Candidatus Moranbacteria bacterium]|nr:hypothetical protein [Candidatus Moranbacteria bacterium]
MISVVIKGYLWEGELMTTTNQEGIVTKLKNEDRALFVFLFNLLYGMEGCRVEIAHGHRIVRIPALSNNKFVRFIESLRVNAERHCSRMLVEAYIKGWNAKNATDFHFQMFDFLNNLVRHTYATCRPSSIKKIHRIDELRPKKKMERVSVKISMCFWDNRVHRFISLEVHGRESSNQEKDYWVWDILIPANKKDRPFWIEMLRVHSKNYFLNAPKDELEGLEKCMNGFFAELERVIDR